ncbi:MAG: hypothetical protein ACLSHC_01285 [Bilophila wadsworthia]
MCAWARRWCCRSGYRCGMGTGPSSACSSLVIMVGGGLALAYTNRSQTPLNLTLRDGFAVVGICWIVSFAGGLPFVLTSTASVTDAVFEAASGFTTTARRFLQISRACRTACSCGAA